MVGWHFCTWEFDLSRLSSPMVYNMYTRFWKTIHWQAVRGSKVSGMQENIQKITKLSLPHPNFFFLPSPPTIRVSWDFFDRSQAAGRPPQATLSLQIDSQPLQLSSPTITVADCHPARREFILEAVVGIMTTIGAQPLFLPLGPPPSLGSLCHDKPNATNSGPIPPNQWLNRWLHHHYHYRRHQLYRKGPNWPPIIIVFSRHCWLLGLILAGHRCRQLHHLHHHKVSRTRPPADLGAPNSILLKSRS